MAEMNAIVNRSGKRNRASLKVDLTAMVDLGFLLITFFMLASSMFKPMIVEVLKPDAKKPDTPPQVKDSKTLIMMVGANDMIYSYGLSLENGNAGLDSMLASSKNIRNLILHKKESIASIHGSNEKGDLTVIIKPLSSSNLDNLVDIMDELIICQVRRYAIVKPNDPLDQKVLSLIGQTL